MKVNHYEAERLQLAERIAQSKAVTAVGLAALVGSAWFGLLVGLGYAVSLIH